VGGVSSVGSRSVWERERERGEEGQSKIPWRCAKGVALPKEGRKTSMKISRRRRRRQLLGLRGEGSKCRVVACYGRPKAGPRDQAEKDLAACLSADAGCPVEDPERWAAVGRAARALPSMRMVTHPPKCFTVTAAGGCTARVGLALFTSFCIQNTNLMTAGPCNQSDIHGPCNHVTSLTPGSDNPAPRLAT
jgi:hypothetical protein